ncbi:TPA: hypothetical protein ACGGHE_002173 [Bacillus pseudomycoides]
MITYKQTFNLLPPSLEVKSTDEEFLLQKVSLYPALTGSKTPALKLSKNKEISLGINCP